MDLLIASLLAVFLPPSAGCAGQQGVPIQVSLTGLKDRKGRLKLDLYPASEADFLRPGADLLREGKVYRRVFAVPPASGPVTLCIAAPAAGRYAMVFTHDRDGKGDDSFSIWSDGAGYVGAQKMGRGKPRLAPSIVEVGPGGAQVTIRVQYLRGIGGFAP